MVTRRMPQPQIAGVEVADYEWIVQPRSGRPGYGQTTEGAARWNRQARPPAPRRGVSTMSAHGGDSVTH